VESRVVLLRGEMLIGARAVRGAGTPIQGSDPATGQQLDPPFGTATARELEEACQLAADAFDSFRNTPLTARSRFLRAIGDNILALGEELVERTCAETGLPRGRVEGERARTVGQLRMFADVVEDGSFLDARIDPAIEERKPIRRPDIRQRHIGLGPVAVFGASNFPLAFSVAGGDTASALAAGCPVIVKAHSAHPGTSELVGRAVQRAVKEQGLHEGVFSLLFGSGNIVGSGLVRDARIKAAGFTGSRKGGLALLAIAQNRPEPIPFYGEMSSINPVILLPHALASRPREMAGSFVAALTLGAGQFCTNPGVILAVEGPGLAEFTSEVTRALSEVAAAPMLTRDIHAAYQAGVQRLAEHVRVQRLTHKGAASPCHCDPALFTTDAASFRQHRELSEEIFGAAALIVRCRDISELRSIVQELEGQLTVSVHLTDADLDAARGLLPLLELKAGRIIVNGFGTGVEVGHAMVHGGPFPATSDARTTSVGSLAIHRFLRPVAYQDLPDALLPESLRDANPLGIGRLLNGQRESR
jgi:NADP-dependent aldehyde dehydrogenase